MVNNLNGNAIVKVFKETSTPTEWCPDSLYFILNGNFAETYFTDKYGNPKQVGNTIMISTVSSAGGDKNYFHDQGVPSNIWTVNHNLGKKPSVTVIDSAGTECIGNVQYVDDNNVIIIFNSSFSGTATFN